MTTLKLMFLVLTLSLFGLTATGFAIEPTNTAPLQYQADPKTNQPSQLDAAELNIYNEMLQKQIETVQHYDDRLLSNIHWTLGSGLTNTTRVAYLANYQFHRYAGKQYEEQKSFGLAYTYHIRALEAANSLKYEFYQTDSLDDLIRVLKAGASLVQHEKEDAPNIAQDVSADLKNKTSEFLSLIAIAHVIK